MIAPLTPADELAVIADLFPCCERCGLEVPVAFAVRSPARPSRLRCRLEQLCAARRLGGLYVSPTRRHTNTRSSRPEPAALPETRAGAAQER